MKTKACAFVLVVIGCMLLLHTCTLRIKQCLLCHSKPDKPRRTMIYAGHIYGRWKPGSTEEMTCNGYHHYGCCMQHEQNKVHFVFNKEELKDSSPRTDFEKLIENQNIVLIGDSTMSQLEEGILEYLHLYNRSLKVINAGKGHTVLRITPHRSNGFVSYLMAHIFVLKNDSTHGKINFVNEHNLQEAIYDNDVIIFSIGLHYRHIMSLEELHQHIQHVSKIVQDASAETRKRIIVRSTLPTHFETFLKTGYFEGKFQCMFIQQAQLKPSHKVTSRVTPVDSVIGLKVYG